MTCLKISGEKWTDARLLRAVFGILFFKMKLSQPEVVINSLIYDGVTFK
jgi:hypothetical protein